MSIYSKSMDLLQRAKRLQADGYTSPAGWPAGLQKVDVSFYNGILAPVETPLRNSIPRIKATGGIQAAWKAITGINVNQVRMGVSEGQRGGTVAHTMSDFSAIFRSIGLEDFVNDEAQMSAEGMVDARMKCAENLALAYMLGEEQILIGGNSNVALGTCPTPTVTQVTDSTSAVTNGTLSVRCVALTCDAYWDLVGTNEGKVGVTYAIGDVDPNTVAKYTRTNADGTTDIVYGGVSQASVAGTCTIDSSHKSAYASVATVTGAVAYAWYWGVGASEYLGAITTINSIHIKVDAGTATAVGANLAADCSKSTTLFDGLLSIANTSASGAYVAALATGVAGVGTGFTSDGSGGEVALNAYFADRRRYYKLSPTKLYMSPSTLVALSGVLLTTGATNAVVINVPMQSDGQVSSGRLATRLLNKSANTWVDLVPHDVMPDGVVLGMADKVPYVPGGIQNLCQVLCREDMTLETWTRTSRKQAYGMYASEVLQHFFPPALGVISNIAV